MQNYYQILGIRETATTAQVKAAYEQCMARWQKEGAQDMSARMLIDEAYENLGSELRREWYDASLSNTPSSSDAVACSTNDDIDQPDLEQFPERKPFTERSQPKRLSGGKIAIGGASLSVILFSVIHVIHLITVVGSNDRPLRVTSITYLKADGTPEDFNDSPRIQVMVDSLQRSIESRSDSAGAGNRSADSIN